MKVATWNVNGIRARHQQFVDWASAEQPDVIPFLVFSAGVANLRPDIPGVTAENRFSASAGLGVKIPFNRNVGLRIEGRGYFTSLDGDDECYRCYDNYGDTLTQGETSIGLASEEIAKRAVSCPSQREVGTSDHAPVVATFA